MSTLRSPAPASGFGTCPLLPLSPPSRLIIQRPCSSHTDILYLCVHVCLCARGSQRSVSGAITQKPSAVFCLSRVSLSGTWNLPSRSDWLSRGPQGSASQVPILWMLSTTSGWWQSDPGPHVPTVDTLSTGLSRQLPH